MLLIGDVSIFLRTLIIASYTDGGTGACNVADNEKCEATETVSRYIREGISLLV